MTVGADLMARMLVEQARGVAPEASVLAPLSDEERAVWDFLVAEVDAMAARGELLEITGDAVARRLPAGLRARAAQCALTDEL